MPRDGSATRQRILDSAHDIILERGYAATSIDDILATSGVTKGAFFHHFESKEVMAGVLYEQYLAGEERTFEETFRRAERLTTDPLQQVFVTIGLLEEMFTPLERPHPGCLMASFVYQNDLMTPQRQVQSAHVFLMWREAIGRKLREAEERHQPRASLDHDAVADMLQLVFEGGFIMAKVLDDAGLIVRYLRVFRSYLETVFDVDPARTAAPLAAS